MNLDSNLRKLLSTLLHSWKGSGYSISKFDLGARQIKQLFIKNGWSPPNNEPSDNHTEPTQGSGKQT